MSKRDLNITLAVLWTVLSIGAFAGIWHLSSRALACVSRIDALVAEIDKKNRESASISSKISFYEAGGAKITEELTGYRGNGIPFVAEEPLRIADGFLLTPYAWGANGVRVYGEKLSAEYFRFAHWCSLLYEACPVSSPLYISMEAPERGAYREEPILLNVRAAFFMARGAK